MTAHPVTTCAIAMLLALSGCGKPQTDNMTVPASTRTPATKLMPPETLSPEEMGELIFYGVGNRPCGPGNVKAGDIHSPLKTLAAGRVLDAWQKRTIGANPDKYLPLQIEQRRPGYTTETFGYAENGRSMDLKIMRSAGTSPRAMGQEEDPEYLQVGVYFCAWVPSHVEIVSSSGSAAANYIGAAYRLHWKQTEIAALAGKSGATQIEVDYPPAMVEGRAALTRAGKEQPWTVQLTS